MIPRVPTVPQRMVIVLYGALLLIALLGTTALSMGGRSAGAEPAQSAERIDPAQPPSATLPPSPAQPAAATQPPAATPTAGPSLTATRTTTRTPSPTPSATPSATATATHTFTPSPTSTPSPTVTASPTFTASPTPTLTSSPTPWPTPGPGAVNREVCVPILMYHHIGYAPADADDIERGLTTSPELFERHLQLFAANEVAVINFDDLQYALALGWPLPEKRVIITIDDAYDDVYQYGFPVLEKYGVKATLFVPTAFIDNNVRGYMTWPQIEEMARAGHAVQPHTKDHVDLRNRSRADLIWQILGSKETVEAHTGQTARYFSYPAGQYDDNAITILRELNFWSAVSTDSGVRHTLETIYVLKRLRVSNSIDPESMKVYLRFCEFEVQ